MNLVQIHANGSPLRCTQAHLFDALTKPRPKEITDFVDALSRMFGRIGMHGVCRLCFKGTFDALKIHRSYLCDPYKKQGCCTRCSLLGSNGCVAKPVGCATWMCDFTKTLFPATSRFTRLLCDELFKAKIYIENDYYIRGVARELQFELSKAQAVTLRVLTHAVDAWEEPK